jgi:hypothetical protein
MIRGLALTEYQPGDLSKTLAAIWDHILKLAAPRSAGDRRAFG